MPSAPPRHEVGRRSGSRPLGTRRSRSGRWCSPDRRRSRRRRSAASGSAASPAGRIFVLLGLPRTPSLGLIPAGHDPLAHPFVHLRLDPADRPSTQRDRPGEASLAQPPHRARASRQAGASQRVRQHRSLPTGMPAEIPGRPDEGRSSSWTARLTTGAWSRTRDTCASADDGGFRIGRGARAKAKGCDPALQALRHGAAEHPGPFTPLTNSAR